MSKKVDCEIGLKEGVIDEATYEQERELCQQLSKENGGSCGWGKCADCGVLPFLEKLHKGILVEDEKEIKELKKIVTRFEE
jgi:hypothetical protein